MLSNKWQDPWSRKNALYKVNQRTKVNSWIVKKKIVFKLKSVLVCSCSHNKNTMNWVAYRQEKIISSSLETWKVMIKVPAELVSKEDPLPHR
jgi:hypothetical protein